ncbi:hypothetical protein ACHAWF_001811, partial [Thalassiosira exigua]
NKSARSEIDFLCLTDPTKEKKKHYGRAAVREEQAKADDFERQREANRGMSNVERVLVKTCESQREFQQSFNKNSKSDSVMFSVSMRADRLLKEMGLEAQQAAVTGNWDRYNLLRKKT